LVTDVIDLEQRFARVWQTYAHERRVVVACSGGPDSVALVRLLVRIHPQRDGLLVAHFHHGLRGLHADDDAQFVRTLCQQIGVDWTQAKAEGGQLRARAAGQGIEAAARELRYDFLRTTAERFGARYLATGHTADDQVETILHNLLRGTGLAGLAGMDACRQLTPAVSLVRPLLSVTRDEVLSYLRELGQDFRHDEHNEQRDFLRSRIRHELLPLLERDYYPGVRSALLRLAGIAGQAQEVVRTLASSLLDDCRSRPASPLVELNCRPLRGADEHLQREMFVVLWQQQGWPLQQMTYDHWQRLAEMVTDDGTVHARDFPGAIHVARHGDRLLLQPAGQPEPITADMPRQA
jgi:tRNA(Ile)-lysidine synthase